MKAGPRGYKMNLPFGVELIQSAWGRRFGYNFYKALALVLTFLSYMMYHATRKPPSIVKSVLKGDASGAVVLTGHRLLMAAAEGNATVAAAADAAPAVVTNYGWAPFNQEGGQAMLGNVDLAFLGAYAIGMFFSGHIGDRTDLRVFLTIGMVGSGVFVALFGMAYFWDIHNIWYFIGIQVLAGVFQSTGWPSVVSIMANWFGKGKRGLVMGVWNAHTSLGNILGTVAAAAALQYGWGWSFVGPGVVMAVLGLFIYALLVVQPSDAGLAGPYEPIKGEELDKDDDEGKSRAEPSSHHEALSLWEAWAIPGVSSFALCLFFSKLIAYTFLYWLPYYINATPIQGTLLSPKQAGDLSVLFDVGGVAGGVLAGYLSDRTGASALVATSFTLASVPFLYGYRAYGHISFALNVAFMMAAGFFVNGPYALITTAVSADLGSHESLQGNNKALATVTAIIDGMGSIGAAVGPMLTGYISEKGGFDGVFLMLYTAASLAGLLLVRLCAKELQDMKARSKSAVVRTTSGVQMGVKA